MYGETRADARPASCALLPASPGGFPSGHAIGRCSSRSQSSEAAKNDKSQARLDTCHILGPASCIGHEPFEGERHAAACGLRERDTGRVVYMRATLTGQPPAVCARIAPTFDKLETHADPDAGRALIEFYRRHNEIDLLLPVV